MAYQIHFLGEELKEVKDRETALFHLGAKYGAGIYNKAMKNGYITWTETYVKVLPFKVKEIKTVVTGVKIKKEIVLTKKTKE